MINKMFQSRRNLYHLRKSGHKHTVKNGAVTGCVRVVRDDDVGGNGEGNGGS